jgi:hypothetical protein
LPSRVELPGGAHLLVLAAMKLVRDLASGRRSEEEYELSWRFVSISGHGLSYFLATLDVWASRTCTPIPFKVALVSSCGRTHAEFREPA